MNIEKQRIREYVWNKLLEEGVARFPLPPHGRIPNFIGAEEAGLKLISLKEFKDAKVIKVNPDSPQRIIREYALRMGKILLMPSPRLRKGFLIINGKLLKGKERYASTIKGAFKFGRPIDLNRLPKVDFIVEGSVAVGLDCSRLGKGEGFGEIEYAILRELELVDDYTPIATTVHDIQIFKSLPQDIYDVPVNIIATPKHIYRLQCKRPRPKGIYWSYLDDEKIREMPVLMNFRKNL